VWLGGGLGGGGVSGGGGGGGGAEGGGGAVEGAGVGGGRWGGVGEASGRRSGAWGGKLKKNILNRQKQRKQEHANRGEVGKKKNRNKRQKPSQGL